MSDKCFVDTNVLVYAHDLLAGSKRDRALKLIERLWNDQTGVISTQVLQEFCYRVRRKPARPLSAHDTFSVIQQYLAWNVVVNSSIAALEAMKIEAQYKVSFWDALILRTALRAGAKILYTEDFSHGQMYGGVRAVNPFLDH